MPVRPVASSLRIGSDICDIRRICRLASTPAPLAKRVNPFLRRFLTPREVSYVRARFDLDTRDSLGSIAAFLAGRWAAKEAVIKAIKPRKIQPLEIEIWQAADHEVFALVADPPAKTFADHDYVPGIHPRLEDVVLNGIHNTFEQALDVQGCASVVSVSISHDADYAFAVALASSNAD